MVRVEGQDSPEGSDRRGVALVGFASLVVFLLMSAYERAFAMIFVLNFSTAGPNATVLLVLLFATGLLYVSGLQKRWPHPTRLLDACVGATAVLALASLSTIPTLAALCAIAVHVAATPIIVTLLSALRERMVVPAVLGILLHQAVRETFDTAPSYATVGGMLLFGALALSLAALWWAGVRTSLPGVAGPPAGAALLSAFLLYEYTFMGSPAAVAAWGGSNHSLVAATGALGLLLGTRNLRLPNALGSVAAGSVIVLLSFGILVLGPPTVASPFLLLLAQAWSVRVLRGGIERARPLPLPRMGLGLAGLQLLGVVLVFLHVVAGNWAFVAGVGPLLRGHAGTILLVIALVVPLLALWPRRTAAGVGM